MTKKSDVINRHGRRDSAIAFLILFCVALVGLWEFLAGRSRRPFVPFQIQAADLATFHPAVAGWQVRQLPIQASRIEPNIVAYLLSPAMTSCTQLASPPEGDRDGAWAGPLLVRLVHGYNMPDCMRIKGYAVELLSDTRDAPRPEWQSRPLQLWKLTSAGGEVSIWATSMLRVGDFSETADDVRSMAFPRIGTPDDPNWLPRGIRLESFRHPVRNFAWLIRAKWNNARCDLATFLRLRQPAWASDDLMTLVTMTEGGIAQSPQEPAAQESVVSTHLRMSSLLQSWRALQMAPGSKDARGADEIKP